MDDYDYDDYDLFDDEDNSQSSQSALGAPSTSTPARKRFCEERAETREETEPYSKRSRYDELACSEFDSRSRAATPRSPWSSWSTSTPRPSSSQQSSQSPRPHFSGVLRTSSASAGFAEKTKNLLMTKDKLPLGKLGLAICQHDVLADYQIDVHLLQNGDVRPDVEEGKTIAQTLSSVQQPSDLIFRQLMNVIADQSNMILDSCMVRLTRIETELADGRSSDVKKCQEAKLHEDTCLAFENLTQVWRIPQLAVQEEWPDLSNALFKVESVDLNKKMEKWIRTKRGKPHDHVIACTDFFRVYLKEYFKYFSYSCEPPVLVKRYAVRISDSCAKRPELRDFPEELVEQLIGVCLDGLRLGMRELSFPVSVTALRKNPTPFWLSLGDTDEEREGEFEERKKARARWTVHVRGAFQRALNDIRKYVLDANGRLVPAPKVKIIRIGSQPSTSQRTPQDDEEEDDNTT